MIEAADYIQRRSKLFEMIKRRTAKILVYGKQPLFRIPGYPYDFQQFSDMIYLTGYNRPGGALTIQEDNGKLISTLFLPQKPPFQNFDDGLKTSFDEAQKTSGVDKVLPMTELQSWLSKNALDIKNVFTSYPMHQKPHNDHFSPLDGYIDLLRVIKSPKEISLIKKARDVTQKALNKTLESLQPGELEAQVASQLKMNCFEFGSTGIAHPIVVASGKNSIRLNYFDNNRIINDNECVLINVGAEYNHYISDLTITATIGKIPLEQQGLLQMVIDIKDILVKNVKGGKIFSLGHLHQSAASMMMRGLREFGMELDMRELSRFFPHPTATWMGLDTQECFNVRDDFALTKGCVFSVEPGLYFSPNAKGVPKDLRGFGCRFGDTVIIE